MEYSNICLAGIGRYLPNTIISNLEIEQECNLSANLIEEKLGVKERRIEKKLTQDKMGALAAEEAMKDANIHPFEIDALINASNTFVKKIPDNGPLIQRELGLSQYGIPSFSIQSGINSVLDALELASGFIKVKRYRCILIVASDICSSMVDSAYPFAKALFGDGAAAIVVKAREDNAGELGDKFNRVEPEKMDVLTSYFGMNLHLKENISIKEIVYQFDYDVYKDTYKSMLTSVIGRALENEKKANVSIIQCAVKPDMDDMLEGVENIVSATERYGICGTASILLALYDVIRANKVSDGENILLSSVGDGMTASAMLLQYHK